MAQAMRPILKESIVEQAKKPMGILGVGPKGIGGWMKKKTKKQTREAEILDEIYKISEIKQPIRDTSFYLRKFRKIRRLIDEKD